MSQIQSPISLLNEFNEEFNESSLGSSPTSVSWFIDRTSDSSILEDYLNDLAITTPDRITDNYLVNNEVSVNLIHFNRILNIFESVNAIVNIPFDLIVDENLEISVEELECCICMEKQDEHDICRFNCGHTFCVDCSSTNMVAQFKRHNDLTCSMCRSKITCIHVKNNRNKQKFIIY